MNRYYEEIERIIKRTEINNASRKIEETNEIILSYWNIGKILVEAQGGNDRAKYGDELIKQWSDKLSKRYGKGYNTTSLKRFRQFYLLFIKGAPLGHQLTWTHIRILLPIKEENKRNYYLNMCIMKNISKRELEKEIKNNTYERLINKPKKIELISSVPKYNLIDNMHNPILLELSEKDKIVTEHDLEMLLLARINSFFSQLGDGFALIGNQYKVPGKRRNYYIDILLFNIEMNCYVVVELKVRELKKEDKGQIEFYMNLIDETLKKPLHNKTIGILITRKQDIFIASFVKDDNIIPITYKVI